MDFEYIPGSSAAPKASFDSKSFSEGPINFCRKTKKYISKKVDLAAEKFSFQDFAPKTSLSPMEVNLNRSIKNLYHAVLRDYWELGGFRQRVWNWTALGPTFRKNIGEHSVPDTSSIFEFHGFSRFFHFSRPTDGVLSFGILEMNFRVCVQLF